MLDLHALDHDRVLAEATAFLRETPRTVTAFLAERSTGTPHDFYSEGDYWWPDPKNPEGPYVQRDGLTNPDNFVAHRLAMIAMSRGVAACGAAWKLTRDAKFLDAARNHLRTWFIDPNTAMNPSLNFAQAIKGKTPGRGIGIIDTIHLIEPVRAAQVLAPALPREEVAALRKWFADYLTWLTTSKNGLEERDAANNHGTCWVMQVAAFADFTQDTDKLTFCRQRYREVLLPGQMAPDGSFPKELARTKPYGYSLFNLDAMTTVCQILAPGGKAGPDSLWDAKTPTGETLEKAVTYMFPFIQDKSRWPHAKDVLHWDAWTVPGPALLFAGQAYGRPEWLELWKTLPPTSSNEEIIRNWPIRTPLLWVD